ncbi:MAG: ABC transporter, ATPase subunit [Candidatus Roizmanbacteria bacterium GW2011_GWA2_35_8]|uniref:ABC transporter, ATPase subunit n=1 Tax=Candidatus Roizmanbacteria bacterium GW2011_GWA2_35_8 TaxID=1618479 RepID=A0A0G0FHR0_9BACT|nr:MAG: ABC transporter, ATPase subunit [Candidatus Roizmanbacteria bacterium GW2011_GWA2_35_8]
MNVFEIKNLTKKFGRATAVNNISFALKKGEILGLLGPNGAGKTTTIQILLGITTPDSGQILYFGKEFFSNKGDCLSRINYASAFNTLQGRETVVENLTISALLYEVSDYKKKINELVNYFGMSELVNIRYNNLSSGEKTRTNLIKALLNSPEILLLDEPTASLDPDIADKTLQMIEKLRADHKVSILYTSHNMKEVDRICDRVIFLNHGKIEAEDTPLNLTKRIDEANLRLTYDAKQILVKSFLEKNKHKYKFEGDDNVIIETKEKHIANIIFGLSGENVWITNIEIEKPTLEDVFIKISRNK